ncbi:MAG TPA: hypothetical protein PKD19_01515 [Candidatus Saccharibacteria bacterium]|jgi:hypothetical protein|nr:hypothetical protein [Candidatus Saccharibacteria bacterium]HMR38122.1 hypothetical protein [Candidatus Saccharibacteria bacterium]
MEFIKASRRKSQLSEFAYIALNVGLAVTLLLMVLFIENVWLPIIVVLISKWRIFAVRPRFWTINIVANMVDIIVGVGHVVLLLAAHSAVWVQILLTIGFVVWLLLVKPQSKRMYIVAQALAAVFVGTTALAMVAYSINPIVMVFGMWVIGYSAARHILSSYDEPYTKLYSLVWALLIAELGWLGYHWLFVYSLPGAGNLKLVQLAFITTLLSFITEQCYASYHKYKKLKTNDILMPILFSAGLVLVLLLFFNRISAGLV